MGLFDYLRGWSELEIQGAKPERLLNALAVRNIPFWGVHKLDGCTVRFKVRKKYAETAAGLALSCQCDVRSAVACGAPVRLKALRARYALLAGALVCTAVLAVSSCFVWDIRVVGNETLSKGEIVRTLSDCGAGIGSFWPAFTGDSLRNELLLRLPELRWAAVNYDSSTITVIVRERREKPEMVDEHQPAHIVAERSGIVEQVSALMGKPQVQAHQTVLAGEPLISGAVPSTFGDTQIVHAYGTVQARTWYEIRANRSLTGAEKSYTGREKHRFALTFGTKRVNFYGNSRIYGGDCDKIIEEFPLSVPGVFTLPVTLVRETYRQYEPIPVERSAEELQSEMEAELRDYLDSLVEDGSVMSASVRFSEKNGVLTATLSAECLEDIGRTVLMDAGEIEQIRMENAARRAAGEDQSND